MLDNVIGNSPKMAMSTLLDTPCSPCSISTCSLSPRRTVPHRALSPTALFRGGAQGESAFAVKSLGLSPQFIGRDLSPAQVVSPRNVGLSAQFNHLPNLATQRSSTSDGWRFTPAVSTTQPSSHYLPHYGQVPTPRIAAGTLGTAACHWSRPQVDLDTGQPTPATPRTTATKGSSQQIPSRFGVLSEPAVVSPRWQISSRAAQIAARATAETELQRQLSPPHWQISRQPALTIASRKAFAHGIGHESGLVSSVSALRPGSPSAKPHVQVTRSPYEEGRALSVSTLHSGSPMAKPHVNVTRSPTSLAVSSKRMSCIPVLAPAPQTTQVLQNRFAISPNASAHRLSAQETPVRRRTGEQCLRQCPASPKEASLENKACASDMANEVAAHEVSQRVAAATDVGFAHERGGQASTIKRTSGSAGACFCLFQGALTEPDIADGTCRKMLSQLISADLKVSWANLHGIDIEQVLAETVASATRGGNEILNAASTVAKNTSNDSDSAFSDWWASLLSRFGLFAQGDHIGADEFGELVVTCIRMLRDRHASPVFLRCFKTVRSGGVRLKDRYSDFKFLSRGTFAKHYHCTSLVATGGETYVCQQVRKDRLAAPTDHIRSELEVLCGLDHSSIPRIVQTFEDFNSLYIIVEPTGGLPLLDHIEDTCGNRSLYSETVVANIVQQFLDAVSYCHDRRPHSIVHGDIRMSSAKVDFPDGPYSPPHVLLVDLGFGGMPTSPQTISELGQAGHSEQCVRRRFPQISPQLDVWCVGCMLFVLLTGEHPFGQRDIGAPFLQQWHGELPCFSNSALLERISENARKLCSDMLAMNHRDRPGAKRCLDSRWFERAGVPAIRIPEDVCSKLAKRCRQSRMRQILTEHVLTTLSETPYTCFRASQMVEAACAPSQGSQFEALKQLGLSADCLSGIESEFLEGKNDSRGYQDLAACCAQLAEDLLDHALWRFFMAAGQDHNGVLSIAELEKQLSEPSSPVYAPFRPDGGTGGCSEVADTPVFSSGAGVADIICQLARGRPEITFEDLKVEMIRQQQNSQQSRDLKQEFSR